MSEIKDKVKSQMSANPYKTHDGIEKYLSNEAIEEILSTPELAIVTELLARELETTTPEFQNEIAGLLNKISFAGSFKEKLDLAAVNREAKLPIVNPRYSSVNFAHSSQYDEIIAFGDSRYQQAQRDMHEEGWVKGIKNEIVQKETREGRG